MSDKPPKTTHIRVTKLTAKMLQHMKPDLPKGMHQYELTEQIVKAEFKKRYPNGIQIEKGD